MAGQNLLGGGGGAAFIGMCAVAVQVSAESAAYQLGRLKKRAVHVLGGVVVGYTHSTVVHWVDLLRPWGVGQYRRIGICEE